jgi:SNF2 family DNA or RNA helicase
MLRMQQVSNGFLPREDGTVEVLECSRLEAFDAWLETISDDKLVVWCRFKQDVKLLVDKYKETCIDLSGNVSQQERQVNKDRFIADKKKRFAFGTPDAAGVGIDGIQIVTNRALFYSNSPNSLAYWQARARTSRVGGDSNAFYTHMIGKGTIDKKWIANLTKKEALSSLMLDDIRRLFE